MQICGVSQVEVIQDTDNVWDGVTLAHGMRGGRDAVKYDAVHRVSPARNDPAPNLNVVVPFSTVPAMLECIVVTVVLNRLTLG